MLHAMKDSENYKIIAIMTYRVPCLLTNLPEWLPELLLVTSTATVSLLW